MGLFSFLRKNKTESDPDEGGFYSRAEEESVAVRGKGKRKQPVEAGTKPVDPVLPEKKRARRRLVGAIALVLALIIGLPMILDSEPRPVADDIVIQIPSKDAPENRARIRRSSPSLNSMPKGLDPAEEIIEVPATRKPASLMAAAPPAETPSVAPAEKSVQKAPPALASSIDKVSLKSPAKADVVLPQEQKTVKAAASIAESPRKDAVVTRGTVGEEDKLLAKAEKPRAEEERKSEKIILQVAALASSQKAGELQSKLAGAGIRSHTQKVSTGSGERIRIRVGPLSGKGEADKVRAKLTSLGLNGTVVAN